MKPRSRQVMVGFWFGLALSGETSNCAWAQMVEASTGRFFDTAGWSAYRLGVTWQLGGTVNLQVHGDVLRRVGDVGSLAGLGTDLTAFRTGDEGPYLVAGLSGGLGSANSNNFSRLWGSWSAGAGYDLYPVSFMSVGVEGRWRELSLEGRDGLELGVGLAFHLRRRTPPTRLRPLAQPSKGMSSADRGPGSPATADTISQSSFTTLADSIVATAAEAMGRPYAFGGTGVGGQGFDCSGLIQYAYRKHGITVPRRSVEQARAGRRIDREIERLAPADILTFSNRGGQVTHVGLYLGNGRFIHSATRGVQVSTLSPQDPYGRWWYKRWVGVRRIVR